MEQCTLIHFNKVSSVTKRSYIWKQVVFDTARIRTKTIANFGSLNLQLFYFYMLQRNVILTYTTSDITYLIYFILDILKALPHLEVG